MIKLIKIGGSLLKDKNTFILLKNILNKEFDKNNKIILVVSAIGRINDPYSTDTLKRLGYNLDKNDYDYLIGLGEIISTLVSASNLKEYNPKVIRYNKVGIKKDNKFILDNKYLINILKDNNFIIVPGFIILNKDNELTTLDRGGSDLTAVLIAKMLNLKEITLYKETGGIMSGDPSLVASPYLIKHINYDEVYKLSKLGAKIIQKDAIRFSKENKIKILVKSLFLDEVGSIVSFKSDVNKYIGITNDDRYIYLVGNVNSYDLEVIISLMHEYNILINKIKLKKDYILVEVINGKRNFALNLIHHKFMNKKDD